MLLAVQIWEQFGSKIEGCSISVSSLLRWKEGREVEELARELVEENIEGMRR